VIGHLRGSYDAGGAYGLENLDIVGSTGRIVIEEACERLHFYPRFNRESEHYDYLGGMMSFQETFAARIGKWVEQNIAQDKPEDIDASGAAALHVQSIIEGIIQSWETGQVVDVA
jgi:predicted dehydrogenase